MQLIQERFFIATLVDMCNFHCVAFLSLQSNWDSLIQPDVEDYPKSDGAGGQRRGCSRVMCAFPPFPQRVSVCKWDEVSSQTAKSQAV